MKSFWFWLTLLAAVWTAAIVDGNQEALAPQLWGCAFFFACYFLAPLLRSRPLGMTFVLSACLVSAAAAFWNASAYSYEWNPYLLLIYAFVAGKAAIRLPGKYALVVGAVALAAAILPGWFGQTTYPPMFLFLTVLAVGSAAAVHRKAVSDLGQANDHIEAQMTEYRNLKRHSAAGEETARHQERARIARDMHDSVGHKLTALLMQLEVFRLQSDDEAAQRAAELKRLAQESLKETRRAVMALNEEEPAGMQAILNLIRKWETDNLVRTQFSIRQGVLSVPLSNEQSIAIYRALQEALTNAMRHGQRGMVDIAFEAPGGRVFRFEVSNPSTKTGSFQVGFGLSAMRERLEKLGGTLECLQNEHRFMVRVSLPINRKEGAVNDSDSAGRGSEDGPSGTEDDD